MALVIGNSNDEMIIVIVLVMKRMVSILLV